MKNRRFTAISAALTLTFAAAFSTCGSDAAYASGLPVKENHPRIMLDSTWKSRLIAKKTVNDATWTTLKNRADQLKNWPIQQYTYATRGYWYSNKLFYGFQGSQWYEDAFSLATAYQITGDTAYSAKAIQLAQEIIRAENDPANAPVQNPWGTSYRNPFAIDFSYASRYVGPAMAIIYDWCYAAIPPALRAQMVTQMNAFYLHVRTSPNYTTYERQGPATGNYFGSHLYCAAMMGYATYGDNQQAQSMIDWARIRFDGTQSSLLSGQDIPTSSRVQAFEGPFPSRFETQTNVNPNLYKGKPAKGGFNVQGWAYGTNEYSRQIDYMLMVRSATGENLFNQYGYWYNDMFRSMKHALLPNRIGIDPVADWGGNQGAVVDRRLPLRLGYVLENTSDSAAAYHFAHVEIPQNTGWGAYYTDGNSSVVFFREQE